LSAFVIATRTAYCPGQDRAEHDDVAMCLSQRVRADAAYGRIQWRESDDQLLRRLLINGWNTELLLGLQGQLAPDEDEPGLLALANQWAVVQAYYAIEKIVDALAVAKGSSPPRSHDKTKTLFADQWAVRPCPPWNLRHDGTRLLGLADGAATPQVNTLGTVTSDNCWGFIEVCLRTTRAPIVQQRLREARDRKKSERRNAWIKAAGERSRKATSEPRWPLPHLTPAEKSQIVATTRPTNMLDYLYRLRIRSNYQDASMFTEGPSSRAEALDMHLNLGRLVSWTLLLHELWIRKYAGRQTFDRHVSEWLKNDVAGHATRGLSRRRAILTEAT
jgi:hypothetical protein